MDHADKQTGYPYARLVLDEFEITEIAGRQLADPCPAQVILRLSPRLDCRIEAEKLPNFLIGLQEKMFSVATSKGIRTQAILVRNLREQMKAGNTFRGSLVPYETPLLALSRDEQVRSARFSVLNFPKFYGDKDKTIEQDGKLQRLGYTNLKYNGLTIELKQHPCLSKHEKILEEENGYAITHEGRIMVAGQESMQVKEIQAIRQGLRAFLSFAKGSACGLTLIRGTDSSRLDVAVEWGTTHTESWLEGRNTWLPMIDGGDCLSALFPGFWRLYVDPEWTNTIRVTIDWYLNSKNNAFHVGIILIQAALEKLCYALNGPKRRGDSTGQFLSDSIRALGIDTDIPASCNHLRNLFAKVPHIGADGLKACTEIRNNLIHAEQRLGPISADVQMDALRLGQWYVEVSLLKLFEYQGRYRNRLCLPGESPFEIVPWADTS